MSEAAAPGVESAVQRRRPGRSRADQALSRQVYATLREQILHFERKPFEPISEQAFEGGYPGEQECVFASEVQIAITDLTSKDREV